MLTDMAEEEQEPLTSSQDGTVQASVLHTVWHKRMLNCFIREWLSIQILC